MRETRLRLASLEQHARQPHLTMEADVTADNNSRKRTEGAAAAYEAKHGDSCSAKRVEAGPTSSTSFDMKAEPPALPRRDDVLVDEGAASSMPCLSTVEIRMRTAAVGLLPIGTASTAARTNFPLPFFPWSLGGSKKRTSWINDQLVPFWWSFIQTKSR